MAVINIYPPTARLRLKYDYTPDEKTFPAGTEFDAAFESRPGTEGYAWYRETSGLGIGLVILGPNPLAGAAYVAEFAPDIEWVHEDDWSTVKESDKVRLTNGESVIVGSAWSNTYDDNLEVTVSVDSEYALAIFKSDGWKLEVPKPVPPVTEPGIYRWGGGIVVVHKDGTASYTNLPDRTTNPPIWVSHDYHLTAADEYVLISK